MEKPPDAEQLAERYLAAIDAFLDAMRHVPSDALNRRPGEGDWSPRDVAFHVADVDQLLGLRLRRILGEDYPALAGASTQAGVGIYRRSSFDVGLALTALEATGALNTALIESLTTEDMVRKGRHSEGHDVSAADLAHFMAMHVEAHVRQLKRILRAS
jgi:hypothetical protein